jgi:1-acylglycerone phosphate reductase
MFFDSQRLELAPFGVTVVDLKTGGVQSNIMENLKESKDPSLPKASMYQPAKETIERILAGEIFMPGAMPTAKWSSQVVKDLLKKTPPNNIWRGTDAWLVWIMTNLPIPSGILDNMLKERFGLDILAKNLARK